MYKLAIIGGGPAGYVAAEKAALAGLPTILFEAGKLGGVCLNEGCIPTKTLLYSAKILDQAREASKYGVNITDATPDFPSIMKRKEKVVKKLVGGVRVRLRDAGVEVLKVPVTIKGRSGEAFELEAQGESYLAEKLLVCTGSTAFIPPIPGVEGNPAVMTAREALSLEEIPRSVVIVGGGVIGMEFASLFNSLGAEVTVIEMLPKILGPIDQEISSLVQARYRKKGVNFHLGCKVTGVSGGADVSFTLPDGEAMTVSAEKVLVSVGRRPNLTGFGLENIGVKTGRGIEVDSHMQTSVPGVYAAGDVTVLSMLAHTASRQGEVAVNHILGIEDSINYRAIPSVVYTNPEVACVGASAEEGSRVLSMPMAYSGRFVAENERGEGICKVVLDQEDRIIGVHMVGNPASEIIGTASLAVSQGLKADEFLRTILPHPTVSEILRETLSCKPTAN